MKKIESKWKFELNVIYKEGASKDLDNAPFYVSIQTDPVPSAEEIRACLESEADDVDFHPFAIDVWHYAFPDEFPEYKDKTGKIELGVFTKQGKAHYHLPDNPIVRETLKMLKAGEGVDVLCSNCKNWTQMRAKLVNVLKYLQGL
jgi:hypothetical protein